MLKWMKEVVGKESRASYSRYVPGSPIVLAAGKYFVVTAQSQIHIRPTRNLMSFTERQLHLVKYYELTPQVAS